MGQKSYVSEKMTFTAVHYHKSKHLQKSQKIEIGEKREKSLGAYHP